jgi:hypothetical protein
VRIGGGSGEAGGSSATGAMGAPPLRIDSGDRRPDDRIRALQEGQDVGNAREEGRGGIGNRRRWKARWETRAGAGHTVKSGNTYSGVTADARAQCGSTGTASAQLSTRAWLSVERDKGRVPAYDRGRQALTSSSPLPRDNRLLAPGI